MLFDCVLVVRTRRHVVKKFGKIGYSLFSEQNAENLFDAGKSIEKRFIIPLYDLVLSAQARVVRAIF